MEMADFYLLNVLKELREMVWFVQNINKSHHFKTIIISKLRKYQIFCYRLIAQNRQEFNEENLLMDVP